jgi:dTDP-4-amino-4,6-dideoxygalactose transaminase
MTFIASVTPIIHVGAKPVFVDVEANTGLMDVERVEQAITPKSKAILPVHLYGSMVDMKAIRDIADRYDLAVIEDCAHCIEGKRDDIRPGELGHVACYSFYATKNLTCGEGGALTTNDSELASRARTLRLHGMSKDAATRYSGYYQHWDMIALGWKYNMDDIHAALLIDQIDSVGKYWQRREEICKQYDSAFGPVPEIDIPEIRGKSARHMYTIRTSPNSRDEFLRKMQDDGIGVAVNYRAVHTLKYFRESFGLKPEYFPVANQIGQSTISLPLYPKLKDSEIRYVIQSVKKIVNAKD